MVLYALTIFTSAFLLFLIQPIVAKQILPWFGGSAAVWTTCLVFFQVALLAGYTYADFTTRKLTPRTQVILHVVLLAIGCALLPIIPDVTWKPAGDEEPSTRILGLLLVTIGLPYLLLATTGPLVQAWFARRFPTHSVYRLFALSNFASMLALIGYPFLLEPWMPTRTQAWGWSGGFVLFAVLCAAAGIMSLRYAAQPASVAAAPAADGPAPKRADYLEWLALAALGSWLLLAITNHITQNIASIPFLWLAPLTLYLLSFILCFESDGWYQPKWMLGPLAVILGFSAWGLQTSQVTLDIKIAIPLYLTALFTCCMFLHGELARQRPAAKYLTTFYLMVSLGGALGGLFVGLIAPRIFSDYWELGLGFALTAALASYVLRRLPFLVWVTAIGMAGLCGYFWNEQIQQRREDTRVMERNFYGTLRTKETGTAASADGTRRLIHGVILHGEQYLNETRRRQPTTYYGPDSGVGLAIKHAPEGGPRKICVIGLGSGTLATYGRAGDTFRFYEINPQVIDVAQREFSYLKDSAAAIELSLGDARLNMEREAPQDCDVLAVDAFSSDAIPVHLITKEAMEVYLRHLKPGGVIAFHVTNRFLKLAPVVKQIADAAGLSTTLIIDEAEETDFSTTDGVLVSRDKDYAERTGLAAKATPVETLKGLSMWTDDYNNLFKILK